MTTSQTAMLRAVTAVAVVMSWLSPLVAGTGPAFVIDSNLSNPILWQVFYPTVVITVDPSPGMRNCFFQNAFTKAISPMTKTGPIPGAWEAYGSYQKWLLYLDPSSPAPRLMSHDVDTGPNYLAAQSFYKQVGCGMSANRMIYGQYRSAPVNGVVPVDLRFYNVQTGANSPHVTSDSEKMQFSHDGTTIVYRSVLGGQSGKIYGVPFSGGPEFEISDHDGYDPAISGNLVAWYEPSGIGFNIFAKDISTGETRTVAYTATNPPRPACASGTVLWQDGRNQATTGIDIYGYDWQSSSEFAVTTAPGNQMKMIAGGGLVVWTSGTGNAQTVYAAKVEQPVLVTDLRATGVASNSATLAWTSAGPGANPPTSYELRTRTDGPVTEANWASSAIVPGPPIPKPPGQAEIFEVTGLSNGYHHFAIRERLQDLSYSQVSNSIKVFCAAESDAMLATDGSYVTLSGVAEATGADGSLYVQRGGGASGIKISPLGGQTSPATGNSVTVTGKLEPDPVFYGPALTGATVTDLQTSAVLRRYGLNHVELGGYDARFGGTVEQNLSNMWMPVKAAGRVSHVSFSGSTWSFYLQDGSIPPDNNGLGVLVLSPFTLPPGLIDGSFATVEGISQVARTGGRRIEVTGQGSVTAH